MDVTQAVRFLRRATPLVLLACVALTFGCDRRGTDFNALRAGGELRVALVSVPHTYYLEPDGVLGFDYELLRAFCAREQLKLKLTMVRTRAEAIELVEHNRVHLAAGLLPVSADVDTRIRFGPSYAMLQSLAIYDTNRQRPVTLKDLREQRVEALAEAVGAEKLAAIDDSALTYAAPPGLSAEQLLARLDAGKIDVAILPSLDFTVLRLKYPRLDIAFELGRPRAAAWAIAEHFGSSIDRAIMEFFIASEQAGLRKRLWDRYYAHFGNFDFIDARAFLRAYEQRLPEFRAWFEDAASTHKIDWRLLAAMSYQESHWDPKARSPTGVRGIMMLTRRTAAELKVSRSDPQQSIEGGARYLANLIARLPESITEDQRVWFGLAAYNIGLGHVEDARRLTAAANLDPNLWNEVSPYLALLSKRSVAQKTRYGSARGHQALHFVSSIRRYFDALRQLEREEISSSPRRVIKLPLLRAL